MSQSWLDVLLPGRQIENFLGAVEIFVHPEKARGLRGVRKLSAGELLLIAIPLAYCKGFDKARAHQALVDQLLKDENEVVFRAVNELTDGSTSADPLRKKNLHGIVNCNAFQLTQSSFALYHVPSLINHSCFPNASIIFVGNLMIVRAGRDIDAQEEVTIRYFPTVDMNVLARQELSQEWGFKCLCAFCKLEMNDPSISEFCSRLQPKINILCELFYRMISELQQSGGSRILPDSLSARFTQVFQEVEFFILEKPSLGELELHFIRSLFAGGYSTYRALCEFQKNTGEAIRMQRMMNHIQDSIEPASFEQCKTCWIACKFAEMVVSSSSTEDHVERLKEATALCRNVHKQRYGDVSDEALSLILRKTAEAVVEAQAEEWTLHIVE